MKRVVVVFVVLSLCIAALTLVLALRQDDNPVYVTAPVELRDIVITVSAMGTIKPVGVVDVGSQLSGQIAELRVDFNDEVRQGDMLARLDAQTYEARVRAATAGLELSHATVAVQQAALEKAKAELTSKVASQSAADAHMSHARAVLEEATTNLQRLTALQAKNLVTESQAISAATAKTSAQAEVLSAQAAKAIAAASVQSAKASVRMAQAQLRHAEAELKQHRAALDQAKLELERTTIYAPIDGVIVGRNVDMGQTVAASLEAPTLFTIAKDLHQMEVHALVDEADIGRLRVGQAAIFKVDAFPQRQFNGQITQIRKSPQAVQNVVTYTALISAENAQLQMLPGMTAYIHIMIDGAQNVLAIANEALRFHPSGQSQNMAPTMNANAVGWVLDENGDPKPVEIQRGLSDENYTQVVSGSLLKGQQVIVRAAPQPKDRAWFGIRFN